MGARAHLCNGLGLAGLRPIKQQERFALCHVGLVVLDPSCVEALGEVS
jgi:hypothetical protein